MRSQLGVKDVKAKVYHDFEVLSKRLSPLQSRGVNLPPLPPRKSQGDKKQRIEAVRQGLEDFINSLLSRAEVAGDPSLCAFLEVPSCATLHGLGVREDPRYSPQAQRPLDLDSQRENASGGESLPLVPDLLRESDGLGQQPPLQQEQLEEAPPAVHPPGMHPLPQQQPAEMQPVAFQRPPTPPEPVQREGERVAVQSTSPPHEVLYTPRPTSPPDDAFPVERGLAATPPVVQQVDGASIGFSTQDFKALFGMSPPASAKLAPRTDESRIAAPSPFRGLAKSPMTRPSPTSEEDVDPFAEMPEMITEPARLELPSKDDSEKDDSENKLLHVPDRGAQCETWQIQHDCLQSPSAKTASRFEDGRQRRFGAPPIYPQKSNVTLPQMKPGGLEGYTLASHQSQPAQVVLSMLSPNPPPRPVSPTTETQLKRKFDLEHLISSLPTVASPPQLSPSPVKGHSKFVMQLAPENHNHVQTTQIESLGSASKGDDSARRISDGAYEGQYVGSDEAVCAAWIQQVTGEEVSLPLQESLRSGVILCNLINMLKPGTIAKVSKAKMPFPMRENIKNFCEACRSLRVPDRDNFTTDDLFDARNMRQVLLCIMSLGRQSYHIEGWRGPCLGRPEMATIGASKNSKFSVNTEYVDQRQRPTTVPNTASYHR